MEKRTSEERGSYAVDRSPRNFWMKTVFAPNKEREKEKKRKRMCVSKKPAWTCGGGKKKPRRGKRDVLSFVDWCVRPGRKRKKKKGRRGEKE